MVSSLLAGCATRTTLREDETKNKIYSGTIRHCDLTGWYDTVYDLPFSFVADTVILPYTIPKTIYNYHSEEQEEAPSQAENTKLNKPNQNMEPMLKTSAE